VRCECSAPLTGRAHASWCPAQQIETITYRGSVTDLATDCAYLLTPEQGMELARELRRLVAVPGKYRKAIG